MDKKILFGRNAKNKLLSGVKKLESAVGSTLGPAGKTVIIESNGIIHSTKDGVSVARSIQLKDKFENIGVSAIKEVAEKSNINVGDGTTTSTILASEIFRNGLKFIESGCNATLLKNGIKKASDFVVNFIEGISTPVQTKEMLKKVATVSANGDERIGEIISDVMTTIGTDGVIKVENGNTLDIKSKIIDGMVIDKTYISPYMITNPETLETELNNVFVFIAAKKLTNINELIPVMQYVSAPNIQGSLLIIAEDYQDDIISTIVYNKLRGYNVVAIKAPSYGMNRTNILEDVAIITSGKVVSDESGIRATKDNVDSILGHANRVVCTSEYTIIMGGSGNPDDVEKRANSLRNQLKTMSVENYDRKYIEERLSKITTGIGIISVGGVTESETKEKRDRVDDAFCAAKSAYRNGVVAGGATTLIRATQHLRKHIDTICKENGDEKIGYEILMNSLSYPFLKILKNAGLVNEASSILTDLTRYNDGSFNENGPTNQIPTIGYNVIKRDFVNMFDDGILDPTDVVINEVRNASSIAGLLLTTDCIVADDDNNIEKIETEQEEF